RGRRGPPFGSLFAHCPNRQLPRTGARTSPRGGSCRTSIGRSPGPEEPSCSRGRRHARPAPCPGRPSHLHPVRPRWRSSPSYGQNCTLNRSREETVARSPAWDRVTHGHVERAIQEYDRLGPERFFAKHGFAPTTTYELVGERRRYPPKALLGTAYEFATGDRLGSGDFEGGKAGAVKVLEKPGV